MHARTCARTRVRAHTETHRHIAPWPLHLREALLSLLFAVAVCQEHAHEGENEAEDGAAALFYEVAESQGFKTPSFTSPLSSPLRPREAAAA
eukprot:2885618-Pleurochrysis_carterae.AAC.1